MKVLFGFILILFIGAVVFFINHSEEIKEIEETEIERLNRADQMPSDKESNFTQEENLLDDSEADLISNPNQPPQIEIEEEYAENDDSEEKSEIEDLIDEDVPEYSEEVSSEDFKEFIMIALEELESGDEMAEAIITEMIKIGRAQPDHIEQVKSFYKSCSEKSNISDNNQQLCLKYLEKLND